MVFGRRLADCVKDTAVDDVRQKLLSGKHHAEGWESDRIPPLQERFLPAVVLRCAQHLLTWGIQEEGIFRYVFATIGVLGNKKPITTVSSSRLSGRASLVNRLREEFDLGSDYNLEECVPHDLNPHLVASLFKAYLRACEQACQSSNFDRLTTRSQCPTRY